ncbi:hypothetical protein QBC47DRAFT_380927 [Echria macrotheca]|uniref:Transmembrane protein n=1 Tax=Echria macrotheca TaxID=438768 RepID=A0AAJ0BCD4_9PEZI|nr:hypothetical protein QBC47DRAFT_380927 [Echria macrotheca]
MPKKFFASSSTSSTVFTFKSTAHLSNLSVFIDRYTQDNLQEKDMAAILKNNTKFLTRLHQHPQGGINMMKAPSQPATRRFLSSSSSATPNPNLNPNPSYPPFSLKKTIPNPRMRRMVWVGLGMLACVEGVLCMRFWPEIMGKKKDDEATS